MSIGKAKIYEPESIPEIPLPEILNYANLIDAPRSLAELNPADEARLDQAFTEVSDLSGDLAIQGWSSDLAFSAVDADTVQWGSGTLRFRDGQSFSITGATTGNMAAVTYIYFDKAVSETALQVTTTAANAVGQNKVLIAVAQNSGGGKDATFQVFGGAGGVGTLITADNIAANTITANEIASNTITANEINTSTITTLNLTAGSITGVTITGGTVRTSSGSTRVELNGSGNDIRIYSFGTLRAYGFDEGWVFQNSSEQTVATILATTSSFGTRTIMISATSSSSGAIYLNAGSSGAAALAINSSLYFFASGSSGVNVSAKDILPVGVVTLGDLGAEWDSVWCDTLVTGEIITDGGDIIIGGTMHVDSPFDFEVEDGVIEITSGFLNLAQMTGTEADARADDRDGSMYYRTETDTIRVRINGTWRTVTTS